MKKFLASLLCLIAGPGLANPQIDQLEAATLAAFPRAPGVEIVNDIGAVCGGGAVAPGVYCPSEQTIYVDATVAQTPQGIYAVAHLYGHGLQVSYGVADIALAAIRADRSREQELRSMVTQQVECLAGVLVGRAGLGPLDLNDLHSQEPFVGSHWGANPVRNGPRVSIGLQARAEWFAYGQERLTPLFCSVGEMSAELIAAGDQAP